MHLDLTAEQSLFAQQIAAFATERVAPQAAAIDEEGRFPGALIAELASRGLLGVTIAHVRGGGGAAATTWPMRSRSRRWRAPAPSYR